LQIVEIELISLVAIYSQPDGMRIAARYAPAAWLSAAIRLTRLSFDNRSSAGAGLRG
jgi:hypothetical protein